MKITFCGAAETTTGSQHLIEVNGTRILLDCGLYQGRRDTASDRNRKFFFEPSAIDVVVLSHAHIDHSGNLPSLTSGGFTGNIYSTFATRDLCQIMLIDSARIQGQDTKWLNKRRAKEGLPDLEPLYTPIEAEECMRQFAATDVDYLIMESTYGNREHELPAQANDLLAEILVQALAKKGKVIIPAFAVERTQQLIYVLNKLFESKSIPDVPIFVDSPLAVSATEIFRIHPECFNENVYDFLFEKHDPFGFENLTLVRKVNESKALNDLHGPAIIISASGMCEAGRVLHHLRNTIEDPKNTVLFVGYCAANTLGAKIRDGEPEVPILGDRFRVRAAVKILDSFSGHADRSELLAYFDAMGGSKERVFLVHGEPEQSHSLQKALSERHRGRVEVAVWRSTVEL